MTAKWNLIANLFLKMSSSVTCYFLFSMSGDEGDDEYQAGDDEGGDDYDHGDEGVSLTSKRNKLDKSKKKKKVSQLGGDAKAGDGTFTAKLKAKKGVKEKKTQQQQQPIQQASVINQKLVVENPVQDEEISSSSALPSRCIIQLTGKWFEFEVSHL